MNYTTKELATICKLTTSSVLSRAKVLQIEPIGKDKDQNYLFSQSQKIRIATFFDIKRKQKMMNVVEVSKVPEIIYVTREVHYFESQSNHYTPEKIEQIMREFGN